MFHNAQYLATTGTSEFTSLLSLCVLATKSSHNFASKPFAKNYISSSSSMCSGGHHVKPQHCENTIRINHMSSSFVATTSNENTASRPFAKITSLLLLCVSVNIITNQKLTSTKIAPIHMSSSFSLCFCGHPIKP